MNEALDLELSPEPGAVPDPRVGARTTKSPLSARGSARVLHHVFFVWL